MTNRQGYQQGDVLLVRTDRVPEGAVKVAPKARGVVVAEGEATGHAHVMDPRTVTEFEIGGMRFLEVVEPDSLKHEEHDTQTIEPGVYEIRTVVEKDWLADAVRPVFD